MKLCINFLCGNFQSEDRRQTIQSATRHSDTPYGRCNERRSHEARHCYEGSLGQAAKTANPVTRSATRTEVDANADQESSESVPIIARHASAHSEQLISRLRIAALVSNKARCSYLQAGQSATAGKEKSL